MAKVNIVKYSLGWDLNLHVGIVSLCSSKGIWSDSIVVRDPSEFTAISNLLRSEGPLYYDRQKHVLHTGSEPTGEQE